MNRFSRRPRIVGWTAAAILAVAAVVGPASLAGAAWGMGGSGPSASAAATMPTGVTPTVSANGLVITVSWGAASMSNSTNVAGYTITRYSSAGQPVAVGGTCAGVVAATTCTETVTAGTWTYTDTPVQFNWTGGTSAHSAPI